MLSNRQFGPPSKLSNHHRLKPQETIFQALRGNMSALAAKGASPHLASDSSPGSDGKNNDGEGGGNGGGGNGAGKAAASAEGLWSQVHTIYFRCEDLLPAGGSSSGSIATPPSSGLAPGLGGGGGPSVGGIVPVQQHCIFWYSIRIFTVPGTCIVMLHSIILAPYKLVLKYSNDLLLIY
jgi:hypothetical protein